MDELYNWIFEGEIENVKQALVNGVDPNTISADGMNLLQIAVEGDQPRILALLLEYGADPNLQSGSNRTTALHQAVDYAYDGMVQNDQTFPYTEPMECIHLLLKYGADLTIRDSNGKMAIDYPMTAEIIKVLKDERQSEDR